MVPLATKKTFQKSGVRGSPRRSPYKRAEDLAGILFSCLTSDLQGRAEILADSQRGAEAGK